MYTVESVTSGHPDKVCDQISDAVLDACLAQDPKARVAVEVFGGHNLLVIGGEVTMTGVVDYASIARGVYRDIGYTDELEIIVRVQQQSPDIAQGVDTGGAGDQGIMYGFAINETAEFLPKALVQVHALAKSLETTRRAGKNSLGPDGKTQITMKDGKPQSVLLSVQNFVPAGFQDAWRTSIRTDVIAPIIGDLTGVDVYINPTGAFTLGGFAADTGLTGRKIMVDTYGGLITHGGGAFSGKDPTKVDRSAAYMCRFVAKNIVAHGHANHALVSVAYAIGRAEPLMVEVTTDKGKDIADTIKKIFDFRPQAIIERLNLRRPIYRQTAAYGHFGKAGLPWEEILPVLK